jgi:hypothetical protein
MLLGPSVPRVPGAGADGKVITKSDKPFNRFLLMLPAMCDMSATSVMYIGLNLVRRLGSPAPSCVCVAAV